MDVLKLLSATCFILVLAAPALATSDDAVSIAQPQAASASGGNVSVIIQEGSRNYAESDQTGSLNTDVIEQLGSNNSSTIKQNSVAGTVVDIQVGSGNKFSVTQTGIDPPPVIIVQHR